MEVTVLLFGPAAAAAGAGRVAVRMDGGATAADVLRGLAEQHPSLAAAVRGGRLAVNAAFVPEGTPVMAGDEVALIALVSGG